MVFETARALIRLHRCAGWAEPLLVAYIIAPFLRIADQGPVVQSIVSLTSSSRGQLVKCFTLYNQIH